MMFPWDKQAREDQPADRRPGNRPPAHRSGLGLLYLAIGRREGFADFGDTTEAYLASLAPLIAFDLVTAVLAAASGRVHTAILRFLILLCLWLGPAVISHPLCRRWGRAEAWSRYVNILNWAQMLIFVVRAMMTFLAALLVSAGAPAQPVQAVTALAVFGYALWFQWFVARGTIAVSRWRTVLLLLWTIFGTTLMISIPLAATGNSWETLLK
jgi:hypothetical protein